MINKIIGEITNSFHIVLVIIPILIFFVPLQYSRHYFKWILLYSILTPLHWKFFDNQCFLTILAKKFGAYDNSNSDSAFSERNCKWIYKPIMNLLGWEWNEENLDKIVNLHWIIYIIILWIYIFFYLDK